ncbi:hypothetical protein [Dactylosporangium sp. CS-033363]|uniref:hypothetical protein n=1 Tax=Dactylosporangium sp. CS-033363 TaxID=3239935 RepID=UPI003D8D3AF9
MSPEELLQRYAEQDIAPTRRSADDVLDAAKTQIRRGRTRVAVLTGIAVVLVVAGAAFALPSRKPDKGLPAVPATPSPSWTEREYPPAFSKPGAALHCTAKALPDPAGADPVHRAVQAMDPTGRWIVGSSSLGLLVWENGRVSIPSGGKYFAPNAVDASGTVAGYEVLNKGGTAAAIFRSNRITRLPTPEEVGASQAMRIDAHGNVLGFGVIGGDGRRVILYWPASGGVVKLQSPPELTDESTGPTGPSAMNDDGVLIGHVFQDKRRMAYRWNADGTGTVLDSPAYEGMQMGGDWVVGDGLVGADREFFSNNKGNPSPYFPHVRWNLRSGTADALGRFQTIAVSASGRLVGMGYSDYFGPAVWSDGTVTKLPLLKSWKKPEVRYTAISADGRTIVASSREDGHGEYDIVQWTC